MNARNHFGRRRGRSVVVLGCGPSFADLDFNDFDHFDELWPVNAAITEIPRRHLDPSRVSWFANHLDEIFDNPIQGAFRERLAAIEVERFPLIAHEAYIERYASRFHPASIWYHRAGLGMPEKIGSAFACALWLAGRFCFEEIVVAGADFIRQPVDGEPDPRHWPHYVAPFDWKPRVPYRLNTQRNAIHRMADRGELPGGFFLHPTSRWPKKDPFPRWERP